METFLAENGIQFLSPPENFNLNKVELGEINGAVIKLTKAESLDEAVERITICGGRPAGIKEAVSFIKGRKVLTQQKDFFIVIYNNKKSFFASKGLLITRNNTKKELTAQIAEFQKENSRLVIPYCCAK